MRPSSHIPGRSLDRSQRLRVWRSWLARSVFFAWVGAVAPLRAETVLSLPDLEGGGGDTVVVDVGLANGDAVTALQFDLPLGGQLHYMTGSARLTARAVDHAVSARVVHNDTLRIVAYSGTSSPFAGSSGPVCSVALVLGRVPGTYALTPTNGVAGGQNSTNVLTRSVPGSIVLLAPQIVVSADSLAFTRTIVGNSQDLSVSVANVGTSGLHLDSLVVVPAMAYQVVAGWQADLEPGQTTSATVRFAPPARGVFRAALGVFSTDPDQPRIEVGLTGPGYRVNELHLDPLSVRSGADAALVFRINNQEPFTAFQFDLGLPGPASLLPGSARLSERSQGHSIGASVSADGRVRVVGYSATGAPFSGSDGVIGQVNVHVDGLGGWYSIAASGVTIADSSGINVVSDVFGTSLRIAAGDIWSGPQVDFGRVSVLDTGRVELPLGNAGDDTLTITQVVPSDPSTCWVPVPLPLRLPPGTQTTLPVRFHSDTKGALTGRLLFRTNDPDEDPYLVPFAAVAFTPNTMSLAAVRNRQTGYTVLSLAIDNLEPFTAFQADLVLPAGVSLSDGAAALTDRNQGHALHLRRTGDSRYRVMAYSLSQACFAGHTGAVMAVPLVGPEGAGVVRLESVVIGDGGSDNISSQALGAVVDSLAVLVTAPHPPVLNPIGPQSVVVGDTLRVVLSAADADGDSLTFAVADAPWGAVLVDSAFCWAPRPGQGGAHNLTFTVAEGRDRDSETVTIAVTDTSGIEAVRPTSQWVTVYGQVLLADGQPAPVGTVVDAVDAAGNVAGWCQVESVGTYGYLTLYLDDPLTPEDEGANVGEALTLRVNRVATPSTATWGQFGDVSRIDIVARPRKQVAIPLAAGFNLVCWNLHTGNDSIGAVMAPILSTLVHVQGFETSALHPSGASTGAKLFSPGGGAFNTLKVADRRLAYWVKVRTATTLTISGWAADSDTSPVPLARGFNLVAYLPEAPDSTWHAMGGVTARLEQVQGFETAVTTRNRPRAGAKLYLPAGGVFNTLRVLSPGLGYWVKVSAADTLRYPASPVAGIPAARGETVVSADESPAHPTDQWIAVYGTVTDVSGRPAPAGTIVDAVDAEGHMAGWCSVDTPGFYRYLPLYLDDPATDLDEGARVGEVLHLRVDGARVGEPIRWTEFGDVIARDLAAARPGGGATNAQPLAFALHPCHPNPFNPGTTVRYDLPGERDVRLCVYTVAGQRVRELVSTRQAGGTHQANWDGVTDSGAAAAAGVYICDLRAGDQHATRRMLLVK